MGYIQGESRSQTSLFPVSLEELIPEDHLVRVIDLYVSKSAFVATCRAFVQICRTAGLIAGELVAIDGSKFQAAASARRHLHLKQLKRQEEKLDKRITQYLAEQDRYQCPAGKWLTLKQLNKGERIYQAAINDCVTCPLKQQCTKAQRRYLMRNAS